MLVFLSLPCPHHTLGQILQTEKDLCQPGELEAEYERQSWNVPWNSPCWIRFCSRWGTTFGNKSRDTLLPLLLDLSGKHWLSKHLKYQTSCGVSCPVLCRTFLAVCNSMMSHAFHKHFLKRGNTSQLEMWLCYEKRQCPNTKQLTH